MRSGIHVCVAALLLAMSGAAQGPIDALEATRPNDPLYASTGSWLQTYEDQWGLRRIGFFEIGSGRSAWEIADGRANPVTVAVIDTDPQGSLAAWWTRPTPRRKAASRKVTCSRWTISHTSR